MASETRSRACTGVPVSSEHAPTTLPRHRRQRKRQPDREGGGGGGGGADGAVDAPGIMDSRHPHARGVWYSAQGPRDAAEAACVPLRGA